MTKVEELRRHLVIEMADNGNRPHPEGWKQDLADAEQEVDALIEAAEQAGAGAAINMFTHEVLPHCSACIQACASGSKFIIDYAGKGLGLPIIVDNPKGSYEG